MELIHKKFEPQDPRGGIYIKGFSDMVFTPVVRLLPIHIYGEPSDEYMEYDCIVYLFAYDDEEDEHPRQYIIQASNEHVSYFVATIFIACENDWEKEIEQLKQKIGLISEITTVELLDTTEE